MVIVFFCAVQERELIHRVQMLLAGAEGPDTEQREEAEEDDKRNHREDAHACDAF